MRRTECGRIGALVVDIGHQPIRARRAPADEAQCFLPFASGD